MRRALADPRNDLDGPALLAGLYAVPDRVLHEGLDREAGDGDVQNGLGGVHGPAQALAETEVLEGQVLFHDAEFLPQRHHGFRRAQGVAEQAPQGQGEGLGLARPLQEGRAGYRVQGVEQEMRLDLVLKADELSLPEGALLVHELAFLLPEAAVPAPPCP